MPIATINPATGETLETFQPLSNSEIEQKLELAVTTFRSERKTPFAERARRMLKAAQILERDRSEEHTSEPSHRIASRMPSSA